MSRLIAAATRGAPPRGVIAVIVIGVIGSLASGVLARNPGATGNDAAFADEKPLPGSKAAALGNGGSARGPNGAIPATGPHGEADSLWEGGWARALRAGTGARLPSARG